MIMIIIVIVIVIVMKLSEPVDMLEGSKGASGKFLEFES